MACDSRSSDDDGEYHTTDDKIERIGKALIGCASNYEDIFKFLDWYRNRDKERPEIENCLALELDSKGIWLYANTCHRSRLTEPFFAIGSGSLAARAAMKWGATPAEAVSYI
jgi:20S proteasome alpha/beta subunit